MEKNLIKRMNEVFKEPEILEKLNDCKSIEEVYASCADRLPDVTFEEFKEIVCNKDTSVLDEKDLESVAGGGVEVGFTLKWTPKIEDAN